MSTKIMIPRISRIPITMIAKIQGAKGRLSPPVAVIHTARREGGRGEGEGEGGGGEGGRESERERGRGKERDGGRDRGGLD